MTSRLRTTGLAVAAGVVSVLAAAGCGAAMAPLAPAGSPSPLVSPVSEQGAVPWVDQPGQFFEPSPLPVHYRPANAPPCTAARVRVSPAGRNGATGFLLWYFTFRNVSAATCVLRGYPHVVASEPGMPGVSATHNIPFIRMFAADARPGNMPPGGVTMLTLVTSDNCAAGATGRTLIYHTVTITIPGGGQAVVSGAFGVQCGLFTSRFAVRQPAQHYTHSPVAGAWVTLDLPRGAVAGTTLDYIAALTNPTGTGMVLSPCPGYQQGIGPAGKAILALNCRAQRRIPAHQTVRFAMRLHVPAGTPTGPADVHWIIAAPGGAFASGMLHVYGHDTPCRPAQLHASIAGPGQIPGPPNTLGMKGMATAVPLTVTNISGRACAVYGVPSVTVRAADGADLGLRQIPIQNYSLQPIPQPQTAITLAPHTGTAQTTLYWYLPWCGPDPNPVTVTITLPANDATITMTPARGWNPPPCHRGQPGPHNNPGLVSADPFRSA